MIAKSRIEILSHHFNAAAATNDFKEISPLGFLPPTGHAGIWWTNSAILPVIYDFYQNKNDIYVTQPCLRVFRPSKNFPYHQQQPEENTWDGPFPYFHMQAVISTDLTKILKVTESFLSSEDMLDKSKIYVSSDDKILVNELESSHLITRIDSVRTDMGSYETVPENESDYHQWKTFGAYGLHGRGADVTILMQNGRYRHIGQIMQILDSENKTLAYSFGYGVEAFLRRKYSNDPQHTSFSISDIVDINMPGATYLMDCISTVCAMQSVPGLQQSSTNTSRHGALLRKEYRNLAYTCELYKPNIPLVESIIQKHCTQEFPSCPQLAETVISTHNVIQKAINDNEKKFLDYCKNILDLVSRGKLDASVANEKITQVSTGKHPVPTWRKTQILG